MKILKKIAIGLVALIAILLIVALFVKKDFNVEREIVINKPKKEVFDYIRFIKNQDNYSKWNMTDPNMKKTYRGTDGTPGFVYSWESDNKNVGSGEQEIKNIKEGEIIEMKLRFKVPFENEDDAYMKTIEVSPMQTKVVWGFKGTMPYPMNLMALCMNMDKHIGDDLDTGLKNLKTVLEKQ